MDLIISLNKPRDITSQGAVTRVKRILRVKKAGHTGTLDPMATGLLLVCINKATRLASYFSPLDKEYRAVMKLGESTDTQDAYGKIIEKADSINLDGGDVENTLKSFEGRISQTPPMFSALKHKGKPLYNYARKGIEIAREPKEVYIYRVELLNVNLPFVRFNVLCSKGTYIRTLCDDMGKKLGVGAHLFELERTAIGPFSIKDSLSIEELNSIDLACPEEDKGICTLDSAMSWMPELKVKEPFVKPITHGNPIRIDSHTDFPDNLKTAAGIRIKAPDGKLLAIGSFSAEKKIVKMDVVFGVE